MANPPSSHVEIMGYAVAPVNAAPRQVTTFLEVNPNGQFGWLDAPGDWPLHRAVLDAVSYRKTGITPAFARACFSGTCANGFTRRI
jgi:hypothetical protein